MRKNFPLQLTSHISIPYELFVLILYIFKHWMSCSMLMQTIRWWCCCCSPAHRLKRMVCRVDCVWLCGCVWKSLCLCFEYQLWLLTFIERFLALSAMHVSIFVYVPADSVYFDRIYILWYLWNGYIECVSSCGRVTCYFTFSSS